MLKKPLILHEGYPFIAGALLIAVILAWAGHIYVAVIPFVLSCYFTFFFRCPDRNNRIPEGEDILVSPSDGTLTKVGYQLTGIHPRNFTITPNGKFLLVACRDTNEIQVFARDAETGLLQDTGKTIHTDKPVCLQWVMK